MTAARPSRIASRAARRRFHPSSRNGRAVQPWLDGPLDTPRLARRGLRGVELALDDVEPTVPEARVRKVDPDDLAQLLGAARPARGQQLEVGGHERRALLLVAAVDGERQELAV